MGKSQREGGGKGKGRREGSVGKMHGETKEPKGGGGAATKRVGRESYGTLIKKKRKFSSYKRKFRREQLQSHI